MRSQFPGTWPKDKVKTTLVVMFCPPVFSGPPSAFSSTGTPTCLSPGFTQILANSKRVSFLLTTHWSWGLPALRWRLSPLAGLSSERAEEEQSCIRAYLGTEHRTGPATSLPPLHPLSLTQTLSAGHRASLGRLQLDDPCHPVPTHRLAWLLRLGPGTQIPAK